MSGVSGCLGLLVCVHTEYPDTTCLGLPVRTADQLQWFWGQWGGSLDWQSHGVSGIDRRGRHLDLDPADSHDHDLWAIQSESTWLSHGAMLVHAMFTVDHPCATGFSVCFKPIQSNNSRSLDLLNTSWTSRHTHSL